MINQHKHQTPRLTAEELHQVLSADFKTGVLTWKTRPMEMFTSKRSCSIWNKRFAGKVAFESSVAKLESLHMGFIQIMGERNA